MFLSKISFSSQRPNNSVKNQGVTYPKLNTLSKDTVCFSGAHIKPLNRLSRREVIQEFQKTGDLNAALIKLATLKSDYAAGFSERIVEKIKENLPKELQESVTSRVKGFESTRNKIYKKYNQLHEGYLASNGEIPSLEISGNLLSKAFGKIDDCIGVRLNISSEKQGFKELLSKLLKSSLNITEINNYSGNNNSPYIKAKDLSTLIHDNKSQIKFQSATKESGYKAIHLNGDNFEIQIKSKRMTDFGNWEHDVKYKSKGNSGSAYKDLGEEEQKAYHAYLVKCYDYISKLDNNVKKAKEPTFPEVLNEILKYKNFNTGNKFAENFDKPRLEELK